MKFEARILNEEILNSLHFVTLIVKSVYQLNISTPIGYILK